MLKKTESEYYLIANFFTKDFWSLYDLPKIVNINAPSIGPLSIGKVTGKFNRRNYAERYNEVLDDKNYQISFQDESLVSMFYKFSESGEVIGYNLSFIPSVDIEVIDLTEESDFFDVGMVDYIRIDFDNQGYEEILHETQHVHFGISFDPERDGTNLRKEKRLPISEIIYPWDFIYLILRFVYHLDKSYDSLFQKFVKERRELIKIENQIFHLCYNFK
ncbi:DUF2290 domain-containing protein [Streptococcus suis]|uniref:DUF2290 domain-containing protein n=1 Tax=Streptococcus suis TaxID=1307 RepID=UPI0005CCCD1D|nr:DUF2290 domain-containing protein [Streptococcus suis]NRG80122.1 DUF2290 domain-containing protein [Streptococcus suis]CZA69778.1 Uncharacterized conserved protein (DUF2290) [Streptococcus suis]CZB30212.1 Uncharacterized conserved protein (DUF2290) [Streptococcus suis]